MVIIVVVNCTLPGDVEELAGRIEAENLPAQNNAKVFASFSPFLELRPESNPVLNV